MRGPGDNSGASFEEIEALREDDAIHEIDPGKLFYFVKWNLSDYIAGTQDLTVEQEGVYIRFLVRLYDRGKPFPDDDKFMVTVLGLSTVRVWKRLRNSLLEIGKIVQKNGFLTNSRFEKEKLKRAAELRKQADAARKRWARERAKKEGLGEVSPKFAGSLGEVCSKQQANSAEKSNEINGSAVTTHMPSKSLESRELDREEERYIPPPESGTARVGGMIDKRDPFGLNPGRAKAHADVWYDADDRLQVSNGFQIELIALAGSEQELRIQLDRASEWIGPNTPPQILKTKVRGRIQSQISERRDRDRRYERAKASNENATLTADGKTDADAMIAKHQRTYRGVL